MNYENETFRKAARDAGISGKNWRGDDALDDFSHYYHDNWSNWDRERDGYDGIYQKAHDWWSDNGHKYS